MSPIPPPEKKSAIEKVIEKMLAEAARGAMPLTAIVHPSDEAEVRRLLAEYGSRKADQVITVGTPGPTISEGPLMKAYREMQGQKASGISWDEQHSMDKSELQQQLEDSLWALAQTHLMVHTREELYQHVGPGHMEDDWYVKKTNGGNEVHLLCKCRLILVMTRCRYGAEISQQCDEPAFPQEATLKRDARCGLHMGTQKGVT